MVNRLAISGALSKWQISVFFVSKVCVMAGFSVIGLVLWVILFRAPGAPSPTPVDLALIAGLPVLGAAAFLFMTWSDRWVVIEFRCDDEAFQYRRLGQTSGETRGLWEVQAIQRYHSFSSGDVSYVVRFLDGSQVSLRSELPNVKALAERLWGLHRLTSSW